MTNKDSSFESTIEDIERKYGIIDPKKLKKPGTVEIEVDEYGRMWRRNERGTVKWRVNVDGSEYRNRLDEEMQRNKRIEAYIAKVQDKEIKELMEEEYLYHDVGGSAAQWQELERKKEAAKARRGKVVPPLPK